MKQVTILTSDNLNLEAELVVPPSPTVAAVLTHPHPKHGGNMKSMVPGELIDALPTAGVATLRFNFRGMGHSQGHFEDGAGERLDVVAAVELLSSITEGLPLVICGSSFGADTALTVDNPRISGWCAMAPPLRAERRMLMQPAATSSRPKLLIIAERDQFCLPQEVRSTTEDWKQTNIEVIAGADHFFIGRLDRVIAKCVEFVTSFGSTVTNDA